MRWFAPQREMRAILNDVQRGELMATRWNDWYWKGAGAFGAGRVPIGYVTSWSVSAESGGTWTEVAYTESLSWSVKDDAYASTWMDV